MKKKILLLSTSLLFLMGSVLAQRAVTGKVTSSDDGTGIPGVNVVLKGTTSGTITDVDGNYRLEVPEEGGTLVYSFIGLNSQESVIGSRSIVDIVMTADLAELEEIVVLGYNVQDRTDVTSAIASVDVTNMSKRSTADVTQALQGTVTGVKIKYTDANPGSPINMTIRGVSSPSGTSGSPPLVVVDGVMISGLQNVSFENIVGNGDGNRTTTGLENINPNDIESMEILKDASAAAIYGSRAANGVILITTKKGKKGAPQVSFNAEVGVQTPYKGPETANTAQYMQILQSMYGQDLGGEANDFLMPQAALDYLENPSQFGSYDWYDLVYSEAFTQTYDVAVSGGGDFGNYRVSAGYKDQDGVALGTGYERINLRANSDFNVSKRLKFGQSIAISNSEVLPEPYAFSRSVMFKAIAQVPHFSPYGINPDPANDPSAPPRTRSFYWGGGDNPEALIRNPLDYANFWSRSDKQSTVTANLYGEYQIISGLKFRLSGSYNRTEGYFKERTRTLSQPEEYFNAERFLNETEIEDSNWNVDNILSYDKTIGKHSINALVGYVAQEFTTRSLSGTKELFLSDITSTFDGPGADPNLTELNGNLEQYRMTSIISSLFYSFDDRYTINFTFRRDGSSRFDESVRYGDFPGISGGWTLSNEGFWRNSGLSNVINRLKLRASYGVLGRQVTSVYRPQATLSFIPYSLGGGVVNGLMTPGPINPFISWEESKTTNFGVDFGLYEDKLTASVDVFERQTAQLISAIVIPSSAGGGEIQTNDGEINNSGVEIELNFNQDIGPVNVNIGLNATYIWTRLTSIPEDLIYGDGAPEWDVPHVSQTFEGRSPGEFWLIETDGIFKSQAEIDSHVSSDGTVIQPDAQPGDIRFVDANDDGQITSEPEGGDRVFSGLGIAPWNAGLNINATYSNFDLTLSFYGNFGSKVYNGPKYLLEQPFGYDNFSPTLLGAYDAATNPNSNFPRNNPNDAGENWNSRPDSDRYLENGNFVKASLIQFGYRLPTAFSEKLGMSSPRVYISGQNLFTISGYEGIDPEQGRDGLISAGIDRGTAPQFRTVLLGFSVNF